MELWVLFAVAATFLVFFAFMRNERVRRVLFCPLKKVNAVVEMVQRYHEPDRPIRITSCNLLKDPRNVDCDQACIRRPA